MFSCPLTHTHMNKLTNKELDLLAEALDLLKRASAEEIRDVIESQDGEDDRIASVEAIHKLQAHAVDITTNHIVEEQAETLKYANELSERFSDSANRLSDSEQAECLKDLHRHYYAALHCTATLYSVESYHQNHDIIPHDVALDILEKVLNKRRIHSLSEYEELEQELVNEFLNL